jgi:hypothetical protein
MAMATATTTKGLRQAAYEARSITLADQHHLIHRARYIGQGIVDEPIYQVPSRSAEGSVHVVHLYQHTGRTSCTCYAGNFGKACSHVGAALVADRQRQEALRTPQDDAMRWYCHGGDW